MEAAKSAINKLTGQHGHHTTEVTEHYQPAVTHERIDKTHENKATTVVDNEIHQEHHHTSVLPVKDQEVLPTQHHHQMGEAQHREHVHGDHSAIKDKIAAEHGSFKNTTEHGTTQHTSTAAPTVAGEHHHHHVHETIQPVIQKQTIEPHVTHTVVPVHETHHKEPLHYTASSLPAVSMQDFKSQGGSLSGLADRVERFEGEPESIAAKGGLAHGHQHGHHGHGANTTGTTGTTGTSGTTSGLGETSRAQQHIDSRVDREGNTTGSGLTGHHNSGLNDTTSHSTTQNTKPSMLQKLNPFKDADGDGKKGLMD